MKKHKSIPLQQRLKRYLVLPLLILWLLSMTVLTWAVGKDFFRQLEAGAWDWIWFANAEIKEGPSGYREKEMLQRISLGAHHLGAEPLLPIVLPQRPSSISSDDWYWGKWDYVYGYQAAFGFYDHQGNPLFTSGGKYLYFPYLQNPTDRLESYAYVDFSSLPGGEETAEQYISTYPGGDFSPLWNWMRFEGSLEGAQFFPKKMISEMGTVYYENPEQTIDTVLYVDGAQGYNYDPGSGFLYQGKYYESPALLLDRQDIRTHYNFFSSVIAVSGSNQEYLPRAVVHCSPFLYAVQRLWPVYLVSGLALLILLVCLLKKLKQQLLEPFWVINRSFEKDRTELSSFAESPIAELQELFHHFHTAQQERHEAKNECQRLQTALDYAKDAEEHRKQLVSAVAHELKTPLAVIHSYTEGLQAGIAVGKEEQYLDIIRQEAMRLDEMVLEMLELSRLEAGKVTLNAEQFCLKELCDTVLTRLAPAIEAKDLQLQLSAPADLPVTADRKRMERVLSNLLTNAVKYTPAQGQIAVRIYRRGLYSCFAVENTSEHLSPEALEQVWDSFYRTDSARDRSGTGLGLAIVKNIITLHRGECHVCNTPKGVEFSFRIPL